MTDSHSTMLRVSDAKELPLQASKWLAVQMLIDADEMQNLLSSLGQMHIFLAGTVCHAGEEELSRKKFSELYCDYVNQLKAGSVPDDATFRSCFSAVFTTTPNHLYQVPLGSGKCLVRVAKPIVQLQMNKISYSPADQKFRTMMFGHDSISWGLQFSYPQLYQDGLTKEVFAVKESQKFPDTRLFNALKSWSRKETVPTPFEVEGIKTNVPMRLGKRCFDWINAHPQLVAKNIRVAIKSS